MRGRDIMTIKNIFRLSLILVITSVPLAGLAQESDSGAAAGTPGPWIFTFFGVPYSVPGHQAAEGDIESSIDSL